MTPISGKGCVTNIDFEGASLVSRQEKRNSGTGIEDNGWKLSVTTDALESW